MTDDIKDLLGKALPAEPPPSTMRVEDLESRGASAARRRTWTVTGSATAGVAVITAGALLLPGMFASADNAPPSLGAASEPTYDLAAEPADQPEFPLPQLDPDTVYKWQPSEETTSSAETEALSEAFWGQLSEQFPDMRPMAWRDGKVLEPEQYPQMVRTDYSLQIAPEDYPKMDMAGGEDVGFHRPGYGLFEEGEGPASGIEIQLDDDRLVTDSFNVSVHPRGSYAEGTSDYPDPAFGKPELPYLAPGCEDYITDSQGGTANAGVHFDCGEATGPGGEHVQQVTMTRDGGESDSKVHSKTTAVVVTLPNGNAVVASDEIQAPALSEGDESQIGNLSDVEPVMDYDALTAFALNLPPVVVK
ncbi:MAG: hypothetical protein ACRD0P_24365 [Stackebrandtia sp.]